MKKSKIFSSIIVLLLAFFIIEGCKKDSNSNSNFGEDESKIPGTMMTLSAICYVAEDSTPTIIKESIEHLLADTSLATKGNWQLDWGPGISANNVNLVYVVRNAKGDNPLYAIAIRGTNKNSIFDIVEDINVFTLVEFPYGASDDSVSKGALDGLTALLTSKDIVNNTTLEEYLDAISESTKIPLFVTGHSQGGGLAPLMTYWLVTRFKEKFDFITYGFASPGFVNKSFRDNLLNALPQGSSYHLNVNSLDMIPYGYSNLPGIMSKNIPVHVPWPYRVIISIAQDTLSARGIVYYDMVVADTIGNIPIQAVPGITPADTIHWYNHWLATEHSHNNYLLLLDAKPVN